MWNFVTIYAFDAATGRSLRRDSPRPSGVSLWPALWTSPCKSTLQLPAQVPPHSLLFSKLYLQRGPVVTPRNGHEQVLVQYIPRDLKWPQMGWRPKWGECLVIHLHLQQQKQKQEERRRNVKETEISGKFYESWWIEM